MSFGQNGAIIIGCTETKAQRFLMIIMIHTVIVEALMSSFTHT